MRSIPLQRDPTDAARDPERDLIAGVLAADRPAFDALYDFCLPRAYAYIRGSVPSQSEAQAVTQEPLVEVVRSLPDRPEEVPFAAWLFAAARRVLARHLAEKGAGVVLPSDVVDATQPMQGGRSMARLGHALAAVLRRALRRPAEIATGASS
ncbi:MAG TPA: sigma-70 family RNA polymerase sigma factor [Myxococcota bacterium]|nr:sigma-70 family RNA polymerase sigma factor [Myxococcota bacterium]